MNQFFHEIGAYLLLLKGIFAKPEKPAMYAKETFRQANDIGIGSFPVIAIIATFIGAVTAVQFAYQLRGIGLVPMWWIGAIVRKTLILEMAPTLTALLLAGKVGSNIASELGSMRTTEQIDAYEIMGVNTASYLIGPKVIAALVVIPMLVILAVALGILGGWIAGVAGHFYTTSEYMRGVQDYMKSWDVVVMMIKSFLFAFTIATIPCYKGYNVKGGALEIGKASTDAVVLSSIVVIIVNFFVAFFLLD